jgi:diguanylate cyclase (GGDEF)-like protein/PAS domain S-box-containing protein
MHQSDKAIPLTADLREHILSELPCGLCVARQDEGLSVVFANNNFYRMLGYDNADEAAEAGLFGALDCVESKSCAELIARLRALSEEQTQAVSLEARLRRKDGSLLWAIVHISRAESGGGLYICAYMDISAQKRVEEELRVREEEYRIAVRQSDKLVFRYDILEKTAYFPPESAELFHVTTIPSLPDYLKQHNVVNASSREALHELTARMVSGARATGSAVLQLNLACDEKNFEWYRVAYSLIYREDGAPTQAVITLQNISEQHAREVAYQRWEKTYEAMPQGNTAFLEFDLTQNRLDAQKGMLLPMLPEKLRSSMASVLRHYLMHYVHPEDRERIRLFTAREHLLTEYFRGARLEKQEYRHRKEDGSYVWVRLSIQMLPDPYSCDVRASILLRDIDVQKREELILMDQLRTDTLTGALNRGAFMEAANAVFAQPRPGALHALVMVDVDHFKRINDRFGHGYGDRVLARICDLLRNALRADDLVGRIGGDEFVLLLKNVVNREALQTKMDSLCEHLNQRIGDDISVSCSFGAAACPQDGIGFDELYWKADAALYAAKEAGRNCASLYEPEMGRPMPLFETGEL